VTKLKVALGKLLKQKSMPSLFGIGVLNGLLPCGLVYIAVAGATANIFNGASLAGNLIGIKYRQQLMKAVPYLIAIIGIIFIIRGLHLGIPYLSPHISAQTGSVVSCH